MWSVNGQYGEDIVLAPPPEACNNRAHDWTPEREAMIRGVLNRAAGAADFLGVDNDTAADFAGELDEAALEGRRPAHEPVRDHHRQHPDPDRGGPPPGGPMSQVPMSLLARSSGDRRTGH